MNWSPTYDFALTILRQIVTRFSQLIFLVLPASLEFLHIVLTNFWRDKQERLLSKENKHVNKKEKFRKIENLRFPLKNLQFQR